LRATFGSNRLYQASGLVDPRIACASDGQSPPMKSAAALAWQVACWAARLFAPPPAVRVAQLAVTARAARAEVSRPVAAELSIWELVKRC
jgi:hypothetical protein